MTHLSEIGVEQYEDAPTVGEGISARPSIEIHMDRVRNVFDHHEEIGYGETGENHVSGRLHLTTRQHSDIENICDRAEYAYQQTSPAMYLSIPIVEGFQARAALISRRFWRRR